MTQQSQRIVQRYLRSKQAMVGNSFDPFSLSIKRIGPQRFLLEISSKGSIQGNIQHCSDTLRFVSNDVHEMSNLFFALGLKPHRYRLISKSQPLFTSGDRIECKCTVDFEFEADNPREIFLASGRPLGVEVRVNV